MSEGVDLVDFRIGQAARCRVAQVVHLLDVGSLVLALLAELLPCDHDRDRALGNQIVRETSQDDTAKIISMMSRNKLRLRIHLPLQSAAATAANHYEGRADNINDFGNQMARILAV